MALRDRLRRLAARARAEAALILDDPDEAFRVVRKLTGITIGLTIAGAAGSLGLFYVQQGARLEVYLAAALFWLGYLFAHYTATGTLIHQRSAGGMLELDRRERALTATGILLALVGATWMVLAAAQGDTLTTAAALIIGGAGYVMAHYGLTETLM